MAGSVVVGPATRNASAAAGLMPWVSRPLIIGRAVRLVVIGDGPLKKDLEEQASSLGVSAKVTFAGFVSDDKKAALLAASDLYVSTSQHEGFGLVFLEGMSAGIPVVCYDFGGQTDFLDDGLTGALVPLNDLSQFTNACVRFMDSPEDRIAAGKENLQRVESFYIDTCAQEYERLFASVIEQHLARKS